MSKVIVSPVRRWPGTVVLADPLSFPQVFAVEDAFATVRALGENTTQVRVNHAILPGLMACVEEWHLEGFAPDPFPATPKQSSAELVAWLIVEISALFAEAEEPVPNE